MDVCFYSALIFFLSLSNSDRLIRPHTYTSLSQFLDFKHQLSSALKEDKRSDLLSPSNLHSLWVFYVAIITTCEFWHWTFVLSAQPSSPAIYLTLFSFSWELNEWTLLKTILKLNQLTAFFHLILQELQGCSVIILYNWMVTDSWHSTITFYLSESLLVSL